MPALSHSDDYEVEFGKAVCDRLGLDPFTVLRDSVTTETVSSSSAVVRLSVFAIVPRDDLMELRQVAIYRVNAARAAKQPTLADSLQKIGHPLFSNRPVRTTP